MKYREIRFANIPRVAQTAGPRARLFRQSFRVFLSGRHYRRWIAITIKNYRANLIALAPYETTHPPEILIAAPVDAELPFLARL